MQGGSRGPTHNILNNNDGRVYTARLLNRMKDNREDEAHANVCIQYSAEVELLKVVLSSSTKIVLLDSIDKSSTPLAQVFDGNKKSRSTA